LKEIFTPAIPKIYISKSNKGKISGEGTSVLSAVKLIKLAQGFVLAVFNDSFRKPLPHEYYRKSNFKKILAIQDNFVNVKKNAGVVGKTNRSRSWHP
jgi:hypothetical protein